MKNTILLLFVVLSLYSCQDIEVLDTPQINMGVTAKKTQILSTVSTGSKVTVMYNLTVGAKYSVQVYPFAATEPAKTLPLTAEEEIVTRVYDFTDLPNGIYDLTLTDISGVSIKKPIIIKR
jgi:spore germination protein YaaH